MANFPDSGAFRANLKTGVFIDDLEALLATAKQLPGAMARTTLVIDSEASISPTLASHAVDTYNQASSGDLRYLKIDNTNAGMEVRLRAVTSARVVTVKNNADTYGIRLSGGTDKILSVTEWLHLKRNGSIWEEISPLGGVAGDVMMSSGSAKNFGLLGPAKYLTSTTPIDALTAGEGDYVLAFNHPDNPYGGTCLVHVKESNTLCLQTMLVVAVGKLLRRYYTYSNSTWSAWKTMADMNAVIKASALINGPGTVYNNVNVASCVLSETGQYQITFTEAAPSAHYALLITTSGGGVFCDWLVNSKTPTGFNLTTKVASSGSPINVAWSFACLWQ